MRAARRREKTGWGMRLAVIVSASCAALLLCSASAFAQIESKALLDICNKLAANPLDTNRPDDVEGSVASKIDPKVAIPACEAARKAAPDDPRIAYQLGRAYHASKAYESARPHYEKAVEGGYLHAVNNLAAYYTNGLGVPADVPRGIAMFEKAANAGLPLAMRNLGERYRNGKVVPKDLTVAREWLRKGAEAGDIVSMTTFGIMLEKGEGGAEDLRGARSWFQKAADAGNRQAMFHLGRLLANGDGGARDLKEARNWYLKAANAGHAGGMNNYALALANGDGGPTDAKDARVWYLKAIGAGNNVAMNNYGGLLYNGSGGPKNLAEARDWYKKAAQAGVPMAMKNYSIVLAKGDGGPADAAGAKHWREEAAKHGLKDSRPGIRRKIARRSAPMLQAQEGESGPKGYSREALYARCRYAVFRRFSTPGVISGKPYRGILQNRFLVPQVDGCVANGGKVI